MEKLQATSPQLVVDIAWWRPDPQLVKQAGYVAAIRYLSSDVSKAISVTEAAHWHAAGMPLGLVWEDSAQAALGGAAQGLEDARKALQQCENLSYDLRSPVWFAVDFDVTPNQMPTVMDYLKAANSVFAPANRNFKAGYGSISLVQSCWAAGIAGDWQTEAWSRSDVSPQASLYQRVKPTRSIPGGAGQFDEDVVLAPIPWWGAAVPPPTPTPPAPRPKTNPFLPVKVDGLFIVQDCAAMQWVLKVAPDGLFGPITKEALQRHLGVAVDGVVGLQTTIALQRHVGAVPDGIWGPATNRALQTKLNSGTF